MPFRSRFSGPAVPRQSLRIRRWAKAGSVAREVTAVKPAWLWPHGETRKPPAQDTAQPQAVASTLAAPASEHRAEPDPLYLFACHVDWKRRSDTTAGWELIAAAQSSNEDTRAQARALLSASEKPSSSSVSVSTYTGRSSVMGNLDRWLLEGSMRIPYSMQIIDTCTQCNSQSAGFFCGLSRLALQSFDIVSQHTILPAGAILFVEGQQARGMFVLCSGRVKLSTTSRDGKILILKTCDAGEPLGLSAAISGDTYEMTAETCTPCQMNFVSRRHLLNLLELHSSIGVQVAQFLSREFQAAYRDMHDLVLARSSAGKLARLLLSCPPDRDSNSQEMRLTAAMTHEEMAQRIGSSRETVTRLLSELKKRHLIRSDGATLVIRDRNALEALAV